MKICQLTDFVDVGGAGIAASRIADALMEIENVEICRISTSASKNCNKVTFLENSREIQLLNLWSQYFKKSYLKRLRDFDIRKQLKKILEREKPDIINVHNIHSAGWPFTIIQTCLQHSPVSWTLHDCWSFLGSYYKTHSPAPTKELKKELDAFWRFQHPNLLTATSPSTWMGKEAAKSKWSNSNITTIQNPIPKNFFENKNVNGCKATLGLSTELPTILVIAGNLNEERKGGGILKSILESGVTDKAQILLIGEGTSIQNKNIKSLGFINDEITIQIAYHAADLLLHPAPVDNLPNTVAESISCGTPILAFKTGGVPEMVIPEKSGWLVEDIETEPMIEKLNTIISDESYRNLRKSTGEIGLRLFDSKKIGNSYLECFEQTISRNV